MAHVRLEGLNTFFPGLGNACFSMESLEHLHCETVCAVSTRPFIEGTYDRTQSVPNMHF